MRNALWWVIVIRGALGVVLMYMATDLIKIASRDRVALGAHGLNGIYRITLDSQVIIGICHLVQLFLVTLTAFIAYSMLKTLSPDAPVEQFAFRFYSNLFLFVYTLLAGVIIVRKKYERSLLYREAEIEIAKKAREESSTA